MGNQTEGEGFQVVVGVDSGEEETTSWQYQPPGQVVIKSLF